MSGLVVIRGFGGGGGGGGGGWTLARRLLKTRWVHTATLDPASVQEVRIPVPWGHIAGKWWGDKSRLPVVALHGVQDNASSFDRLAPLLRVDALLALDLPGHGRSSHFHPAATLHLLDYVAALRYVLEERLGVGHNRRRRRRRVQLLGHSFGSNLCFAYAALHPRHVDAYIGIDCGRYNLIPDVERTVDELRELLDWQLETERKRSMTAPEYGAEELLKTMLAARKPPMDIGPKAASILLSRGTRLADGDPSKVVLSRDLRLKKRSLGRLSEPLVYAMSARLTCRVGYVTADRGIIAPFADKAAVEAGCRAATRSASAQFQWRRVDGGHHVHLEHPERVAPFINQFLRPTEN